MPGAGRERGDAIDRRALCSQRRSQYPGVEPTGEAERQRLVEAEVDWGQAKILLRGELVDAHLFLMRPCFSGASFVCTFALETQQAFLESHVAVFEWFGGVFDVVRFEYVPWHIFVVLCPTELCARAEVTPATTGIGGRVLLPPAT